MDRPVPSGFVDIEDWLLHYIYHHPKDKHTTYSLHQQLDAILKAEPPELNECNRRKRIFGLPEITAEEYMARRNPELTTVQRAVETLLKKEWANGKRESESNGMVFFSGLALTRSGTKEVIRRAKETKKEMPSRK